MRALAVVVLVLTASVVEARDLASAWSVEPAGFRAWLAGGGREEGAWVAVSDGPLLGVAALPQSALAAGWRGPVSLCGGWQRTGSPGGVWSEQRFHGEAWAGDGVGYGLAVRVRVVESGGEAWPVGWGVHGAVRVVAGGWRGLLRSPLAGASPSWTSWGREPWLGLERRRGAWLITAGVAEGVDRSALVRVAVWGRWARDVAFGAEWDGASGSPALLLAVGRGGLLVRSRHAVHPLLGPHHQWQLAWSGVRP